MNSQNHHHSSLAAQHNPLVLLACGELSSDERQALIAQILQNPAAAFEAKLALRLADESTQMASTMVQCADALASTKRSFTWGFRALVGGTCAGLMMLFAMPNVQNSAPARSVAGISVPSAMPDQMMSSSGFEAPDSDFGGSFE